MEEAIPAAGLVALAYHVTVLLKYVTAGQIKEFLTGLVPWVAAFSVLLLGSEADATASVVLPGFDLALGDMDVASLLLAAAGLGATGSVAWDYKKAIDGSDSASVPPLGGGSPNP